MNYKIQKILGIGLLSFSITSSQQIEDIVLPAHQSVVHHLGYSLEFSYGYNQAKWVALLLTKNYVNHNIAVITQKDTMRSDSLLSEKAFTKTDLCSIVDSNVYFASQYINKLETQWDQKVFSQSYYLSNYYPIRQNKIETNYNLLIKGRSWADKFDSIFIIAGPIFNVPEPTDLSIKHEITIPAAIYRMYVSHRNGQFHGIGFVFGNDNQPKDYTKCIVTIDSIQKLTGIDFFPGLPDNIENAIEKNVDSLFWFGTIGIKNIPMKIVLKNSTADNRIFDLRGRLIGTYTINSRIENNSMVIINKKKFINVR